MESSTATTIEEQKLLTEPKYRVYMSNIDKALKNFEYSSEWADLISALGKLTKVSGYLWICSHHGSGRDYYTSIRWFSWRLINYNQTIILSSVWCAADIVQKCDYNQSINENISPTINDNDEAWNG